MLVRALHKICCSALTQTECGHNLSTPTIAAKGNSMRTASFLLVAFLMASAMLLVPVTASSHSGGTNAEGCHTNRSTGEYHCHTPKVPAPGAVTYCHVLDGQSRCGYARGTCADLVSQFGGTADNSRGSLSQHIRQTATCTKF